MLALDAAQIDRDLCFERGIDRLAEIVPQQHIFGRNSRVGLELEHPMAVGALQRQQRLGRLVNVLFKRVVERTVERRCALLCCRAVSFMLILR